MTDYLPLSSQQLETIHQSAKGIISRIPRLGPMPSATVAGTPI